MNENCSILHHLLVYEPTQNEMLPFFLQLGEPCPQFIHISQSRKKVLFEMCLHVQFKNEKGNVFTICKPIREIFIHSNLISYPLIGSLVNTRSVLKMSTALHILHPDCARCFCWVIMRVKVTSTDPFFSLGKVVNILHF